MPALLRQCLCTFSALAALCAQYASGQCLPQSLPVSPELQITTGATGAGGAYFLAVIDLDGPGPDPQSLLVGGDFTHAGGIPARNLAAWNGTAWTSFGGVGSPNQPGAGPWEPVLSGAYFADELVIGLQGLASGSVQHRVNGAWVPLGTNGPTTSVYSLIEHDGALYAAASSGVMRWDGSTWTSIGVTSGSIRTLIAHEGAIIAAGTGLFPAPGDGGQTARNVARWDGVNWRPVGGNTLNASIITLFSDQSELMVGTQYQGAFRTDDSPWSLMGGNPPPPGTARFEHVTALCSLDGNLFATGRLRYPLATVAYYANHEWNAVPGSPYGDGYALCTFHGQLFAGTNTGLARIVSPTADFNHDGDSSTDADIQAFFACLAGDCCLTCATADFNGDGDTGTDADIEAFFRVLSGGSC